MSEKSITLEVRDDNSTEDAERVVAWARGFKGADAHIVFDYIDVGAEREPGALNGVTIQWGHEPLELVPPVMGEDSFEFEFEDLDDVTQVAIVVTPRVETPAVTAPAATFAVHVRAGGTVRRVGVGFEVDNPELVIPDPVPSAPTADQVAAAIALLENLETGDAR